MMPTISQSNQIEALIVGGGPAGAATATLLARRGQDVEIVEQSAAMHHKKSVVSSSAAKLLVGYLAQIGLDLDALGAVPIHSVRLARRKCIAESELPFPALSITRRKLDEALLTLAQREGAVVRRGRRIESLHRSPSGWTAQFTGGEVRHAQSVFLATGKHDLGGYRRPPGKQDSLIAFKMYFQLAPAEKRALRGWVELTLFPGGYAGMQLTEEGDANLCLLVNRITFESCGNDWQELLKRILWQLFRTSCPAPGSSRTSAAEAACSLLDTLRGASEKGGDGALAAWRSGSGHAVLLGRRYVNRAPQCPGRSRPLCERRHVRPTG